MPRLKQTVAKSLAKKAYSEVMSTVDKVHDDMVANADKVFHEAVATARMRWAPNYCEEEDWDDGLGPDTRSEAQKAYENEIAIASRGKIDAIIIADRVREETITNAMKTYRKAIIKKKKGGKEIAGNYSKGSQRAARQG